MWMRHWRQATVIILALALLASCGFFVDPVLTSITISPSTALIKIGGSQTFTALGVNQDNSTRSITPTWSISPSDGSIATITAKGVATGVANGTATITGTSGSITATATLNVSNATVSSIAIGNCPSGTINPGASVSLTATATLSDNSTQVVTTTATWASSDTTGTIATVGTNTGVVTAGANGGTANITASYSGVTSSACSIIVL